MLIADYHLQFSFGYQIRFRAFSSGIENVQKYRVVLGFLKRARAGLRIENHDPVPTLRMLRTDAQTTFSLTRPPCNKGKKSFLSDSVRAELSLFSH